eukprot:jgi/Mesvir1/23865/Mv10661-RA.1
MASIAMTATSAHFSLQKACPSRPVLRSQPAHVPVGRSVEHCRNFFGAALRPRLAQRLNVSASRPGAVVCVAAKPPRLIQHKQEAYQFYRFLSIVYDKIVNPLHWDEEMREDALSVAGLDSPNLKVVDVGAGTGFCTLGVVKSIPAKNVTMVDQSPHQLQKAKQKEALKECTIMEGDAEDVPLPTDAFDRYVSAGSIEYWPEPQRGICEAYRLLKPGGKACLIGPVHPTNPISAFFADVWMLFPKESEYIEWFTKAGFTDVQIKRIGPSWYRGVRRHGLIMGCSVTGVKPVAGESPLKLGPKAESLTTKKNPLEFALNLLLGTLGGFYYFWVPIYMWIKNLIFPKSWSI